MMLVLALLGLAAARATRLVIEKNVIVDADGRRLETCEDDTDWRFITSKGMEVGCDWVSKKTPKRCKKEGSNGTGTVTSAWTSCPVTCGTCCSGTCCDSTSWYYQKEKKGCGWAGQGTKWRCSLSDGMGVLARESCPVSCDACPPAEPKCDGDCCDDWSWHHHLPRKNCDWVAEKRWRCSTRADGAGVLAEDACKVSCGTCPDPTAPPTFRLPSTMAEKTECLSRKGEWTGVADVCETCCPACTAVVGTRDDMSSFTSHFEGGGAPFTVWTPTDDDRCICLDLDADEHDFFGANGGIALTPSSDCARVTGDGNSVAGDYGDDAMVAEGDGNRLFGMSGDDHLVMNGTDGQIWGDGGDDVCTDLGDNQFYNELPDAGTNNACEICLGPGGVDVPLDCATGETFSPTAKPTA